MQWVERVKTPGGKKFQCVIVLGWNESLQCGVLLMAREMLIKVYKCYVVCFVLFCFCFLFFCSAQVLLSAVDQPGFLWLGHWRFCKAKSNKHQVVFFPVLSSNVKQTTHLKKQPSLTNVSGLRTMSKWPTGGRALGILSVGGYILNPLPAAVITAATL